MPKISKEQIQEIKRRPSAESVVPDLPSECAGSYQELGYYRHGVKRAECLMPYWDKINYFDLPGIDVDFHNRIADYKRIFKAADALTRLKMRLASKSFNAKLIITDKIAPETDDLKSIFAIIKELPGNLDFHGLPCYEEALRAFCEFELEGFFSYLSDLIGLDSFLTFKRKCNDYITCKKQDELPKRFSILEERYASFVDDITACEDDKMSIGFGETDDTKVNFDDIYGELKNTKSDFDWIIRTLKSMPDNQDRESDWKDERGCYFNVSIDPRHNPFAYETKSLRLYDYGNGRSAPDEIEELISHLADQWGEMFSLLNEKFNFLENEVETAQNAFETFMDFISDVDEYTPGDTACEVIRKTNIQNVETAMTAIAKTLNKSHTKKTIRQNNTSPFQSHLPGPKEPSIRASEKTTAENNDLPLNIDDACHRLYEEEMESRKKRWLKFRDLLIEAGLVIPIEEWPMPIDWGSKNVNLMYAHLHEQINWSLDKIKSASNPMTPQDDWESLLPDVFSFDLGHFAFRPMETYDDGIYRTVTLIDGTAINISKSSDSSYITYPPRDQCVAALEEYIREGVRISKLINSTSNRTWRKAEAKFQKHRTLINLPISYLAMKELGELLHDARIELTLDIEDHITNQEESKAETTIEHNSTQTNREQISSRYLPIEKRLAVYAKMNPTITRFKLLCSILEDGISEACHGDADLEVWKEPWIAATLQLMSEDPCDGDCNLLNRQILFNAIIAPFTKLIDLLTILQSTDAEALADEYDYFFQDINDIMSKCWQKQPGTGKSGVVITPTFLTRETSNDGWEFDARNIRKLASHCEAQNAIATYRQKAISQEDQLQVDAVNIPKSDSASGNLCTHLLFASAISDAEKIVTALESATDETLCTILSDGCSPLTIFQPFYATYYTPYTYYPEKSKKDLELGLSIQDDISTLKSWIERLFKCLQKIRNGEAATRAAISQWKKIEALYDFRNLNPHLRLTRGQQNDFSDKLIELERLLISATQKENQASTTASSQVTASPRATRENNLQIRPGNETNTSHSLDATSIDSELSPPNIEFQKKLYCGRFKVSKDFKYIIDTIHRCKEYPSIQNLENTGGKVIEVLKKLFTAYGKKRTSGWVYSGGGSWCPHFGKKPYSTFKKQQIETRRNPSTNKSEWRIIPLAEFDEESPIGLHSKRKNHSNLKNNF